MIETSTGLLCFSQLGHFILFYFSQLLQLIGLSYLSPIFFVAGVIILVQAYIRPRLLCYQQMIDYRKLLLMYLQPVCFWVKCFRERFSNLFSYITNFGLKFPSIRSQFFPNCVLFSIILILELNHALFLYLPQNSSLDQICTKTLVLLVNSRSFQKKSQKSLRRNLTRQCSIHPLLQQHLIHAAAASSSTPASPPLALLRLLMMKAPPLPPDDEAHLPLSIFDLSFPSKSVVLVQS